MSKTCDLFVRMGAKLVGLCEDECKACIPLVRMRVRTSCEDESKACVPCARMNVLLFYVCDNECKARVPCLWMSVKLVRLK
jgi:hypothetical protein